MFNPFDIDITDNTMNFDHIEPNIPMKEVIERLGYLPPEHLVRQELQIALPGVSDQQVQNLIMQTLNL